MESSRSRSRKPRSQDPGATSVHQRASATHCCCEMTAMQSFGWIWKQWLRGRYQGLPESNGLEWPQPRFPYFSGHCGGTAHFQPSRFFEVKGSEGEGGRVENPPVKSWCLCPLVAISPTSAQVAFGGCSEGQCEAGFDGAPSKNRLPGCSDWAPLWTRLSCIGVPTHQRSIQVRNWDPNIFSYSSFHQLCWSCVEDSPSQALTGTLGHALAWFQSCAGARIAWGFAICSSGSWLRLLDPDKAWAQSCSNIASNK